MRFGAWSIPVGVLSTGLKGLLTVGSPVTTNRYNGGLLITAFIFLPQTQYRKRFFESVV